MEGSSHLNDDEILSYDSDEGTVPLPIHNTRKSAISYHSASASTLISRNTRTSLPILSNNSSRNNNMVITDDEETDDDDQPIHVDDSLETDDDDDD